MTGLPLPKLVVGSCALIAVGTVGALFREQLRYDPPAADEEVLRLVLADIPRRAESAPSPATRCNTTTSCS